MKAAGYCETVLVIGGGSTAREMANRLLKEALPVIMAVPETAGLCGLPAGVEVLPDTRLTKLAGQVGDFKVHLESGGHHFERRVGTVVVALDTERKPVPLPSGAEGGDRVWSLSEAIEREGRSGLPQGVGSVVFLDRLDGLSTTASDERLFRWALDARTKYGIAAYVLGSQVKVASQGLELLYGQMRDSGCLLAKAQDVRVEKAADGLWVRFRDLVLDEDVTVRADLLVVAEDEMPSPRLGQLAEIIRVEQDQQGFLQADNVLRRPCLTSRRGVLAVGPSAGASARWDIAQGIAAALTEIRGLYHWLGEGEHPEMVAYNRDYCAFCLTCFRVCPHGAIDFTDRPNFLHLACQTCGLCASACPGEALELRGYEKATFFKALGGMSPRDGADSGHIVALACRKSAGRLLEALDPGDPILQGLEWVEVPCAGTIRTASLLGLLARREMVGGVLILACHEGNCRSGQGTRYARRLVENIQELMRSIGWEDTRIGYISTAANDAVALKGKIRAFRDAGRPR